MIRRATLPGRPIILSQQARGVEALPRRRALSRADLEVQFLGVEHQAVEIEGHGLGCNVCHSFRLGNSLENPQVRTIV